MELHFHREMEKLKQHMLALSAEVEHSIQLAQKAVVDQDVEAAKQVIAFDKTIDRHEVDVEEECLKILALYRPVATDLRLVVAILKINADLERMADLCRNIGEYILEISKFEPITISEQFRTMFGETRTMTHQAIEALVSVDTALAERVCKNDYVVDQLNVSIIHGVRDQIERDASRIRPLLFVISISRSLERIADYATNIAEDVVYLVQGVIIRHNMDHSNA